MQVLIVDSDLLSQVETAMAFMQSGYQATPTASLQIAEYCIANSTVDILVISERVEGKLTHSLALMAEHRNPLVSTMLMTPRTDPDVDELFLLLPSLHCILPLDAPKKLITKLALASMTYSTGATARTRASASASAREPLVLEPHMRKLDLRAMPDVAPAHFVSARACPRDQAVYA